MKAVFELRQALDGLTEELAFGIVDKSVLSRRIAYVVSALEVFTDLNFNEEEQKQLFYISFQRLEELKEKLK